MKFLKYLLIGFIIVALSCDDETEEFDLENIAINFNFSGCNNSKSANLILTESVEYAYAEGNMLELLHKNVYFNCCQPENNLQVLLNFSGDSIIVNEYERERGQCKCICPYDVELTVGPIPEKQIWLIYKKEGIETFRFSFEFKEGLKGVKIFD